MRIIGLEEHFATADLIEAWRALEPRWQDVALQISKEGEIASRLVDLGEMRLAAMDAAGLDVQVVSITAPGLQDLSPDAAEAIQADANDRAPGSGVERIQEDQANNLENHSFSSEDRRTLMIIVGRKAEITPR